jgi:hypothetical protein
LLRFGNEPDGLARHAHGPDRVKVVTRLMGMLLAAIAVELMAGGLTTLLPGLAPTGGGS